MSEEMKEAMRLLLECADELRRHDEEYQHRTTEALKDTLRAFFARRGLGCGEDMTSINELLRRMREQRPSA